MCRLALLVADGRKAPGEFNSTGIKPGNADIVAATVQAVTKEQAPKYLQCNPRADDENEVSRSFAALRQIKEAFVTQEWGWPHTNDLTDWVQATLLLFGAEGKGTHPHVDKTEAKNIAFALDVVRLLLSNAWFC